MPERYGRLVPPTELVSGLLIAEARGKPSGISSLTHQQRTRG
jgi:hypothetical protein